MPDALARYEAVRRPRANEIVERSAARGQRTFQPASADENMQDGLPPDIFSYDAVTVPL